MHNILLLISIYILFGCGQAHTKKSDTYKTIDANKENENPIDTNTSFNVEELSKYELDLTDRLIEGDIQIYVKSILNDKIKKQETPFENDTSFVFNEQKSETLSNSGWNVFYIKGSYLPSQAEFCIFGSYKDHIRKCYGYSQSVIETYIELKYCQASNESILIYGKNVRESEDVSQVETEIIAAFHPDISIKY